MLKINTQPTSLHAPYVRQSLIHLFIHSFSRLFIELLFCPKHNTERVLVFIGLTVQENVVLFFFMYSFSKYLLGLVPPGFLYLERMVRSCHYQLLPQMNKQPQIWGRHRQQCSSLRLRVRDPPQISILKSSTYCLLCFKQQSPCFRSIFFFLLLIPTTTLRNRYFY